MTAAELGILPLLLIQAFRALRLVMQVVRGDARNRPPAPPQMQDVSHRELPPPPDLQPVVDELRQLGLSRLGEVQLVLGPLHPTLTTWLLSDPAQELTAEAFLPFEADIPPVVGFGTMFGEAGDAYVLTHFREPYRGMLRPVDEPDFKAQEITVSLAGALEAHRRSVDELRVRYGAPYPARTVDDYLHKGRIYVQRFYGRRREGSEFMSGVHKTNRLLGIELALTISLLVATLLVTAPVGRWLLMAAFVAIVLGFELSISRHWKQVRAAGASGNLAAS